MHTNLQHLSIPHPEIFNAFYRLMTVFNIHSFNLRISLFMSLFIVRFIDSFVNMYIVLACLIIYLSIHTCFRDRSLFIAWGGAEDLGGDQMII